MSPADPLTRRVILPGPADIAVTLAPLRRGPSDPCFQVTDDAIWRSSLMPCGPVSARIGRPRPDGRGGTAVDCTAWGAGAAEFLATAHVLLGADDDASDFAPSHPVVAAAHRDVPHLRLARTGRMMEALIPAILEQRVPGVDAFAAWRRLVTRFGETAPGPVPRRMRVPPSPEAWAAIPSWEYHRANVDGGRARTIVACARRARSIERLSGWEPARARAALTSLPGVGEWTAAETAQRALGDPDALAVGDYHYAKMIGWTFVGSPVDDAAMVELLEPMRPHRHRVIRLLEVSGRAVEPRRGPRLSVQDITIR